MLRKFRKNRGGKNTLVEPDEIFLDSKNIQNFDRQQFEGRIEKPISKSTLVFSLCRYLRLPARIPSDSKGRVLPK